MYDIGRGGKCLCQAVIMPFRKYFTERCFIMEKEDLQFIQDQIGYDFKNLDLLQQAFVRRSYSKENGGEDNEVLEFIGDRALDIVVVKILAETFGFYASECDGFDEESDFDEFCCEYSEGRLTEIKKKLVEKKRLARCIDKLDIANYLIMGNGDRRNHIEKEDSVKEDLFEAIIGAVTLDSEWDWKEIQSTVEWMLAPETYLSEDNQDNYVEFIQEWSLKRYKELPWICADNSSYYDETCLLRAGNEVRSMPKRDLNPAVSVINTQEYYNTHFKCELVLGDINKRFIGYGRSKSEARKDVCKLAYHYLEENDLLFSIRDEIENPNKTESIGQLEILARRGYFSIPTYGFGQKYDRNGNPVWKCECHIKEYDSYCSAESSSKKDAKKSAAFEMLEYVLDTEK